MSSVKTAYKLSVKYYVYPGIVTLVPAQASRTLGGLDLQGLYINDSIDIIDKWSDVTAALTYTFSYEGEVTLDLYTNSGANLMKIKPGFLDHMLYNITVVNPDTNVTEASVKSVSIPSWDFSNVIEIGDNFMYDFYYISSSTYETITTPPVSLNLSHVTTIGNNFLYYGFYGSTPSSDSPLPALTFGSLKTVGDYFLADYCYSTYRFTKKFNYYHYDFSTLTSTGSNFLYYANVAASDIVLPDYDFSSLQSSGSYFLGIYSNGSSRIILPAFDLGNATFGNYAFRLGTSKSSPAIVVPSKTSYPTKSWYNYTTSHVGYSSDVNYYVSAPAEVVASITATNVSVLPYYSSNYIHMQYYTTNTYEVTIIPTYASRTFGGLTCHLVLDGSDKGTLNPTSSFSQTHTRTSPYLHNLYLFFDGDPTTVTSTGGLDLFGRLFYDLESSLRVYNITWNIDFPNLLDGGNYAYQFAYDSVYLKSVNFLTDLHVPSNATSFFKEAFTSASSDSTINVIYLPRFIFSDRIPNSFLDSTFSGRLNLQRVVFGSLETSSVTQVGSSFMSKTFCCTTSSRHTSAKTSHMALKSATLPSCDLSNVTSIGDKFLYYTWCPSSYEQPNTWANDDNQGYLQEWPIPDWDFSKVTTIGDDFCSFSISANYPTKATIPASQEGANIRSMPDFTFRDLTTVGAKFFRCFNYASYKEVYGKVIVPNYNFSNLTTIGDNFFAANFAFSNIYDIVYPDFDFSHVTSVGSYFFAYLAENMPGSVTVPAWDLSSLDTTTVPTNFFWTAFGGSANRPTVRVITPDKAVPAGGFKSWFNLGGKYSDTQKNSYDIGCTKGALWETSVNIGRYSEVLTGLKYLPTTEYCISAQFGGLTSGTSYTLVTAWDTRSMPMGVVGVYVDTTALTWTNVKSAITFTATDSVHTLRIYTNSGETLTSLGCEATPTVPLGLLFNGNTYLKKVSFPKWNFSNVVNLQNFMYSVCNGCTSLIYASIPDYEWPSLTNEGWVETGTCCYFTNLFTGCTALSNAGIDWSGYIDFPVMQQTPRNLCAYMFQNCTSLKACHPLVFDMPKCTRINDGLCKYMYSGCTGLTKLTTPRLITPSLTKIGLASTMVGYFCSYMFNGCTGASSISFSEMDFSKLTDTGTQFMSSAFYGCTGLTSVVLPLWDFSSLTRIGNAFLWQLFRGCSKLKDSEMQRDFFSPTTLPCWDFSHVTRIDAAFLDNLFGECTNLYHANLPYWDFSSVTTVENRFLCYTFYGCTNITTVTIPNWNFSNVTTYPTRLMDNFISTDATLVNHGVGIFVPPKKFTGQPAYYTKSWHSCFGYLSALDQLTDVFYVTSWLQLPTDWPYYADAEPTAWSTTAQQLGRGIKNLTCGYIAPHHPHITAVLYWSYQETTQAGWALPDASGNSGGLTYIQSTADAMPWRSPYPTSAMAWSGRFLHIGYHICSFWFKASSSSTPLTTANAFAGLLHQPYEDTTTYEWLSEFRIVEAQIFPSGADDMLGGTEYCPYTGNVTSIGNNFMYNICKYNRYMQKISIGKLFSNNGSSIQSIGSYFLGYICYHPSPTDSSVSSSVLAKVSMPGITSEPWNFSKVSTIGDGFLKSSFWATKLTELIVPDFTFTNVTSIGTQFIDNTYRYCQCLGEARWPSFHFTKLQTIGNYFLSYPSTNAKISASYHERINLSTVQTIGDGFCYGLWNFNTNLKKITMPLWDLSGVQSVSATNYFANCMQGCPNGLVFNTQDDLAVMYDRNQFNRARTTASYDAVATAADYPVPWYTSDRIGAYERIWHNLIYTNPTPKIYRRQWNSADIPLTYKGMYLECNWESFQPIVEGRGGDYLEWEYTEGGVLKTYSGQYLTVTSNQSVTLNWYKVDAGGTKTLTGSTSYVVDGIPTKPYLEITKGTESATGCYMTIVIKNMSNIIGEYRLRSYLLDTDWTTSNSEFTAFHSGAYIAELFDVYDWFEEDGVSVIIDSVTTLIDNPDTEVIIDTAGHDCTLNAVAKAGSQCNPSKFVLDAEHKYDIPYTKVYADQPITLSIEEKFDNTCTIYTVYSALDSGPAWGSKTASVSNCLCKSYIKEVRYNGLSKAVGNAACINWLGAYRKWKDADLVEIILDDSTFSTKTDFSYFFNYMFNGVSNLRSIHLPYFDTHSGTTFYGWLSNIANDTSLTEFYIPTYDHSAAQNMEYSYGGMFTRTPIANFSFPPILNCRNATNVSRLFSANFYGCKNLKSIEIPLVDTTSATNANGMLAFNNASPQTWGYPYHEHLTVPLFDLSNASIDGITNFSLNPNLKTIYAPTVSTTATKSWNNDTIVFQSDVTITHDGDYLTLANTATISAAAGKTVTYVPALS